MSFMVTTIITLAAIITLLGGAGILMLKAANDGDRRLAWAAIASMALAVAVTLAYLYRAGAL